MNADHAELHPPFEEEPLDRLPLVLGEARVVAVGDLRSRDAWERFVEGAGALARHPTRLREAHIRLPGELHDASRVVVAEEDHDLIARVGGEQRSVTVPHAWLRGFLQVQSAATLP